MSDLIDRQAVLDALIFDVRAGRQNGKTLMVRYAEEVIKRIKELPSAQPECEDAVSRFEVLRLIDYSSNDLNDSVDNWYFQGKVKELPSVTPKQPGWTPCDRELPKPNEEDSNGFYKAYLVQDGRWMDVARWDGKYWVAWGYSTVLLNVVAWCELPTPYREGGQDGKD